MAVYTDTRTKTPADTYPEAPTGAHAAQHNQQVQRDTAPGEVTSARWMTIPDWAALVLGIYLALSPLWTAGAPAGWFTTLGIVIGVVALWALATVSSPVAETVQLIAGALVFASPWLGGFAAITAPAVTAWLGGAAVVFFAVIMLVQNPRREL